MMCKSFLSFCRSPFYVINCFFCCGQGVKFERTPLTNFGLCCLWFGHHIQKSLPRPTCFLLGVSWFDVLVFSLRSIATYLCEWCKIGVPLHFSARAYPFSQLCCLERPSQLPASAGVDLRAFDSVALAWVSIFMPHHTLLMTIN